MVEIPDSFPDTSLFGCSSSSTGSRKAAAKEASTVEV
jgi:hypothetical protein